MRKTYLTSDQHYWHTNIITYSKRPYKNVEEMNRDLIARHNSIISKNDRVIIVGDFSLRENVVPLILPELNGEMELVAGNHDRCHPRQKKYEEAKKRYLDYGFVNVVLEMELGPFVVSHFPYWSDDKERDQRYKEYRPKDTGKPLLCGHVHNRYGKVISNRQFDVGCDAWNYTPVLFEELVELMEKNK